MPDEKPTPADPGDLANSIASVVVDQTKRKLQQRVALQQLAQLA